MFVVLFTVNFLMAWARYEITKENIELVNNLQAVNSPMNTITR